MISTESLRYPIGKFSFPEQKDVSVIPVHVAVIEDFPSKLRLEVSLLDDRQLDTPYRENGWTIRQVVHHVADSHINSYCRFKLAMTEDNPVIKPYFEDRWAELPEAKFSAVSYSLDIINAIHSRWVLFLKNLGPGDYDRTFIHPEYNRTITLYQALCMYSWHCNHHLAHITELKRRNGW
jgi:hypothetical protein